MSTEAFHDGRGHIEILVVSPMEEDQEYFLTTTARLCRVVGMAVRRALHARPGRLPLRRHRADGGL